jgi:hypothetical protein
MSETVEYRVIQKFRERLGRDDLAEDVEIVYRVAGGMPHQRVEHELRLSGGGKAEVKMQNALRDIPAQTAVGELDQAEIRELFQKVDSGLDGLVPRSEARFVPDSVVGRITIQVGGDAITLYFEPEEEARPADDIGAVSPMKEIMRRAGQVSKQLLESGKEQGDE